MSVRQTAVAGLFYQADKEALQKSLQSLLDGVEVAPALAPQALIVPHAGYVYSGHTAATAYRCLAQRREQIRRVVLLGPAHRIPWRGMAVPTATAFASPLGDVPLDREALDRICTLPGVSVSDEAHREEHSLEVQLPFLQAVLKDFTLVPVLVGQCETRMVARLIDALWGGPETLVVISTDLSHFLKYEQAQQLDRDTCRRILAGDSELNGEQACGARALNGLLASRHGQALAIELLDLCNSGDTAGDRNRVVGYGAFALH
jgi:AmmeMemoRadiSam system protein B